MDFVRGVAGCEEYAELFSKENIDGAVLALLTDSHLQVNYHHHHHHIHERHYYESGPGDEARARPEVARRPCQGSGQLSSL